MKKISIVFNSRERPQLLKNLLFSMEYNCSNLKDIEVLINFDDDDPTSKLFNDTSWVKFFRSPKEANILVNTNKLARESKGKYVWLLNDDVCILTENWDQIVWNTLEKNIQSDGIIMGAPRDTSMDKTGPSTNYCSFPIVSKEAIDTLGLVVSESFFGLGGDVWIWRIYNELGRVVDIDIMLDHVLHNTYQNVVNPDKVGKEYRQRCQFKDAWNFDISHEVEKLNEKINKTGT